MPEEVNNRSIFSLLEVTKSIQNTLSDRYQSLFWVKAEMNKLNHYPHSGHCFPDLVQKAGGKIIAEMRGVIWREDFIRINALFIKVLQEPLKNGITVLFAARISYDPVYGLSLRIIDIDPSYSLGDLEKEKAETISRLKVEGLFDRNRKLELPMLPKRLAVISVQTSKGYSDFLSVVDENRFGYRIFHMLFPAVLQGEKAVESIISQLERVYLVRDHFDAIAIIRGGGGDVGLNCYNNYQLAEMVAKSPLPVLTGIGHSTNETVTEMIAFKNSITPTGLGEYLLQLYHNFAVPVDNAEESISLNSRRIISNEKAGLMQASKYFRSVTTGVLTKNSGLIDNTKSSFGHITRNFFREMTERSSAMLITLNRSLPFIMNQQSERLIHISEKTELLDPVNTLKRGYSITRINGISVKSVDDVNEGDSVETQVSDGILEGKITKKKKS